MGIAFALIAGILWGIISIFVTGLQSFGLTSLQCVAIRATFSAIFLLIIILIKDRKLLKIKAKDIVLFVGLGLAYIMLAYCYFSDIEIMGGASIPALLLETAPLYVMIFSSIFFKEKITLKQIICFIAIVVGLLCITGIFENNSEFSIKGLIIGILSGVGYALHSIINKKILMTYNSLTSTFYSFLFSSIVLIPLSGILAKLDVLINGSVIFNGISLALVCTVVPFIIYAESLKRLNINVASILATVDLPVATIIGIIVFKEKWTIFTIIGFIIIFLSIIFLNLKITKKKNNIKQIKND